MAYISNDKIRQQITTEYKAAGWEECGGVLVPPNFASKDQIRLGTHAHRLSRAKRDQALVRERGAELLQYFASGEDIDPHCFDVEIKRVDRDTLESDLFRFATLFWSIPVSRGYGRRMRYIALDRSNKKVIGIFALGDPVFNLKARDEDIGWGVDDRENRLYHVLDAYALGAVPPYNQLLCGKLMAMLTVTNNVRTDFNRKYRSKETICKGEVRNASLVLVTTTSALGRSSIYNRIRMEGESSPAFKRVGYTSGFGHFQVSDELFALIRTWLKQRGDRYADGHQYGDGPSWRMRAIRRAFDLLDIQGNLMKHGVRREVFMAPLARNYGHFLRGDHSTPRYYDRPLERTVGYFKDRWMVPRSERISEWKRWTRKDSWDIISALYRQ